MSKGTGAGVLREHPGKIGAWRGGGGYLFTEDSCAPFNQVAFLLLYSSLSVGEILM